MNQINIQYIETHIGEMILGSFDNKLCLMDYHHRDKRENVDNRLQKGLKANYKEKSDDILNQTKQQLNEYLLSKRKHFDLPLLLVGTDFQKQVWAALQNIPFATTSSYLQLAKSIDNVKAVRAVAGANGANAISIIIPCHRIIGSNGTLVGYAGGLDAKQHLLNIEKKK